MSKRQINRNKTNPGRDSKNKKIGVKRAAQQELEQKRKQQILIGGAAALVAIVLLTFGLIRFYGDNVVARVNGISIRGSEVQGQMAGAESTLMGQQWNLFAEDFERDVREEAVRRVAEGKLYADFARRNGISVDSNLPPSQIISTVTNAIVNDPALFADFEQHMPEDLMPAAEARAYEILQRLHDGEDFDSLMIAYSEDPGIVSHPNGYTFVANQMVEEFEAATLALEIGEISPLVQTTHGFHIVMRIEPDPDNMMNPVPHEPEDLLGAKHILIHATNLTEMQRMQQAVASVFRDMFADADIVFRGALNRV